MTFNNPFLALVHSINVTLPFLCMTAWGGVKNTKIKYFSNTFIAHKLKSNSYRLLILFKIGIFIPSTDFSNLHDTSHTVDKNLLRKLVFLKTVIQWQIFCSYPVQWKMSSIYKQEKKKDIPHHSA